MIPNTNEGIAASPGSSTNIAISRRIINKLPKPHSHCADTRDSSLIYSELYEIFIQNNFPYRQKDCFDLCIEKEIIKKCNCAFPEFSYPIKRTNRLCVNSSDSNCSYETYRDFIKNEFNKVCINECPLECESIHFKTLLSYEQYPTMMKYKMLEHCPKIYSKFSNSSSENTLNFENVKKNLVLLNIYYDDLGFEKITELPVIDFTGLISEVGGTMGLFLGISFLSFIEAFEVIIQILILNFKIKNRSIDSES